MRPIEITRAFERRFGAVPTGIFRAPGRVNLIGEHTDYNDGLVLPIAIDRACHVAAACGCERRLRLRSENVGAEIVVDLDERRSHAKRRSAAGEARGPGVLTPSPAVRLGRWSDYPVGVALALERRGVDVPGADLLFASDVPLGSGLSSSAALEVAAATALLALAGARLEPLEIARACQEAEASFVGARCGLMDQYASVFGRAGHALLLDCRSLESRPIALPPDVQIVVCNSMVKHALAAGEYNRRRQECEQGARLLGVASLRDVTSADLESLRARLPEHVHRRCRHVVTESARVDAAARALERCDLAALGALLAESHASLARDFEVSCRELDLLVDLAAKAPGAIGARMTGGGFGGCTVNLVRRGAEGEFRAYVAPRYADATGRRPEIQVCAAADGADCQTAP